MKIIGLVGKKESGKTTLAQMINKWIPKNANCYFLQFAGILKTMILKAKICDEEELYFHKTAFPREMMQKIGTNIIREQIDKNFFCKKMIKELLELAKRDHPFCENTVVIIDDIRFENEAALIKDVGGVLFRIVRPNWGDPDEHRSETEMDKIATSVTIFNDSGLENLYQAGKNIAVFISAFRNITSGDLLNADPYDRF